VGQLQVTVTADSGSSLLEFNPDGTPRTVVPATLSGSSTLAAYPDLQATGLNFDPSSVLQSGGTVTLDWNDTNNGTGTANGAWSDDISVVNSTTGQTLVNSTANYNATNIAAGDSTSRTFAFTLPNGLPGVGQLQVTVTADSGSSLLEFNPDGTPRTVVPATLSGSSTLAPYPILVVGTVSAPSTTVLGQPVMVSWTDVNQGTADATGSWVDRIYLYSSLTDTNPTLVASVPFSGTVPAGQATPLSATVNLPTSLVGNFFFGVTTDYFDQVIEASTVRQNTTISSQSTQILAPDLVADSVTTSTNTTQFGQPILVTWAVHNGGDAPATGSWSDELFLSNQPTLGSSAVLLFTQSENSNSPLNIGASYSSTAQVTLPIPANLATGTYYVIAVVNFDDTQVEATTSNNQSVSTPITVTLPPLPALGVSGLSTNTHLVYPGEILNLSYTVTNNGTAAATGSWYDQVYLATDAQGDNLTLLGTFPSGSVLAPGTSYTSNEQVTIPNQATGEDWLVVIADPAGTVLEPNTVADRSQIDSTPLTVNTYTVNVQTSVEIANAGNPIPFTGTAVDAITGQPAPNVPVSVQILTGGSMRTISATTDANGNYTATFQPLPTETGLYQYAAGSPNDASDTPQGQFEIVGMSISSQSSLTVAPGVPLSGSVTVTNLGGVPLTDMTAEVLDAPANIQVQTTLGASTLPGSSSILLNFTVTASDASVTQANVLVLLQSNEGATAELTLPIHVLPLVPVLAAQPGTLIDGMLVGQQTVVTFNVVNDGGAASGSLQVVVPQVDWLSLTSPATISPLAPGQSATVTLQLLPAADLALGNYTGTISLVGQTSGLNVPFQFTAASTATGNLIVDGQDELTFDAAGSPLVSGASVIVSEPQTGIAVASGTTGADGTLEINQLPIGTYNVLVQAPGHDQFQGSVTIQAGLTATVDAFMTSQFVTYQFNVTPATIADQYTFTVNTTFKTNVPAPVVTINPPYIDFSTLTSDTTQINFTLTNQGLIAADNIGLHFDSNSEYTVTPLVSNIGTLPAQSEMVVPVIITRNSGSDAPASVAAATPSSATASSSGVATPAATSGGDCGGAYVHWSFPCDAQVLGYTGGIAYVNFGCPGVPIGVPVEASDEPVGSGGGGGGGGGVSFSSGSQTQLKVWNLCDPKDQAKLIEAAKIAAGFAIGLIPPAKGLEAVLLGGSAAVSILLGVSTDYQEALNKSQELEEAPDPALSKEEQTAEHNKLLYGMYYDVAHGITVAAATGFSVAAKELIEAVPVIGWALSGVIAGIDINKALSDPPQNVTPAFTDALAQLNTETDRLQSVANPYTDIFGSTDWLSLPLNDIDSESLEANWLQAFLQDAADANGNAQLVSSAQQEQLLAMPLPAPITTADAANLIARWNNTLNYNAEGIVNIGDVPPGQSTNFIATDVVQADLLAGQSALVAMQNEGYSGLYDAVSAAANAAVAAFSQANDTGVCATVQLQINQQATVARSAFQASFELDNQKPADTLQNVSVNLDVQDMSGNDATSLFFISAPTLSGLTAVDGTGTLAPDTSGTAGWTIIPTNAAAANGITQYLVGGTLSYTDDGYTVTIPVLPSEITVYPAPSLHVQYFLQQDVYGDDPFTPQVETPQPFGLGIMVTNTGPGDAGDFTITSSQPEIIDNQKGLLINFNIIGAQVGNQPVAPSLTADLGTIASGQTVEGDWLMTSSLDGTFISMDAAYQHSDALGGEATSIIDSVDIHDMVHMVQPNRPGDNGDPAFLVDSNPGATDLPDTLHLADGTTAPVNQASNVSVDGAVTPDHLVVQLTADMTSGWDYIQTQDPGNGYTLVKVVRSDGTQILVGPDAWTTHPVDAGTDNPSDDLLHILDYAGTGSYTLYYEPVGYQPPTVTALAPVSPNPASGPVSSLDVTFSEPVDPTTFNPNMLSLSLNGGPNLITPTSGITLTLVSGDTYQIGGLAALTSADGVYLLTVNPGVAEDPYGNASTGTLSDNWANGQVGPYVVQVDSVSPNPRNTPVDSVDVVFDEPIDPTTFDYHDVSLALNGGSNLVSSLVTVTPVSGSPDTYAIGGLTALTGAQGTYQLTVNAAGITDLSGDPGVDISSGSTDWTMNLTPPQLVSIQQVATNPRNTVVMSLDVTFSEPINLATFTPASNLSLTLNGGPNLIDSRVQIAYVSGDTYQITGFNWVVGLQGTYTLTVDAAGVQDLAGNVGSGTLSTSWVMDTTPPAAATNVVVTPARSTGVGQWTTGSTDVSVSGTLATTGLSVNLFDLTNNQSLGNAMVTGASFSIPIALATGNHQLQVATIDAAGNETDSDLLILVTPTTSTLVNNGPVISQLGPVAGLQTTPLGQINVTFSTLVDLTSFSAGALTLSRNGTAIGLDSSVSLQFVSGTTYNIVGLLPFTAIEGNYTLTFQAGNLQDNSGNAGSGSASVGWTLSLPPVVSLTGAGGSPNFNAIWFNSGPVPIENMALATITDPVGLPNLASLTVTLATFHTGDVLSLAPLGGIRLTLTSSYSAGTLTLSGTDTVAHYQQALRFINYNNTLGGPGATPVLATFVASDGMFSSSPVTATINVSVASGQVLGNRLFYNNSKYDGNNGAINTSDDAAIASDKIGFNGTGTANFSNISAFTRGVTGIMVDLQSGIGTHSLINLTSGDITFKIAPAKFVTTTYNQLSTWSAAPTPSAISVRLGAGTGGSDRVEITWANNAIKDTWLEVDVAADANTGLSVPDIFYFGSAAGDSGAGDTAALAKVDGNDYNAVFNNIMGRTTPVWNIFDYTKDGKVDGSDATAAINGVLTLHYIATPTGPFAPDVAPAVALAAAPLASSAAAASPAASTTSVSSDAAVASGLSLLSSLAQSPPTWLASSLQNVVNGPPVVQVLQSLAQQNAAQSRQIMPAIDQIAGMFNLHDDMLDGLLADLGLEQSNA
jgi:uncharacterized membrane protein